MTVRLAWVDVAKGTAITLVVIGHVWRGLYLKGLIDADRFHGLDSVIYAFHMPLFFMISGFFFFRCAGDVALHTRILDVTKRLLVPLIAWTYIFLAVRWLFSDFTNSRPDITSLFVLPIPGILHFWFLWALWSMQIGFLLLAALLPGRLHDKGLALAALLLASLAWAYASDLPFQAYFLPTYTHAIFFAGGAVFYRMIERVRISWPGMAGAGVIFVGLGVLTQTPGSVPVGAVLLALGMSVSFLVMVKGVSARLPQRLDLMRWAGGFSFAIYMMHTIFSAGAREALLLAGISSMAAHLIIGVIAGIACPIAISLIATRYRLGAILGLRAPMPRSTVPAGQ